MPNQEFCDEFVHLGGLGSPEQFVGVVFFFVYLNNSPPTTSAWWISRRFPIRLDLFHDLWRICFCSNANVSLNFQLPSTFINARQSYKLINKSHFFQIIISTFPFMEKNVPRSNYDGKLLFRHVAKAVATNKSYVDFCGHYLVMKGCKYHF